MAQKTQTVVFGQDGMTLKLLTTNNFPELYHQMEDKLQVDGYQFETFYTDTDTFTQALKRYDQLAARQRTQQETYDRRHTATGKDAIDLIKETYKNKEDYTEGVFIDEILRLSYQAGASDVHFQAEEVGVVMRIRKDGILQTVIIFTHQEFQKYLMKLKFISGVKMNLSDVSQDGRFDFDMTRKGETTKIDVRVSVMPGLRGESLVLRYLDATKGILTLNQI